VFDRKSIEGMMLTIRQKNAVKVNDSLYRIGNIFIVFMPFLVQYKYDELLCLADFNMVRGEDTLVRAILSEKPFIWHAYKQDNNYQQVKVKAFLDAMRASFDEEEVYLHFHELFMQFNDGSTPVSEERYDRFLKDLNKIKHSTKKMSYFIRENCSLIKNFTDFLHQLQ